MKYIVRSLLIGLLIFGAYVLYQLVYGYMATASYVPDFAASYESAEPLQHKAAFGIVLAYDGIIILALFGLILYVAARVFRRNL